MSLFWKTRKFICIGSYSAAHLLHSMEERKKERKRERKKRFHLSRENLSHSNFLERLFTINLHRSIADVIACVLDINIHFKFQLDLAENRSKVLIIQCYLLQMNNLACHGLAWLGLACSSFGLAWRYVHHPMFNALHLMIPRSVLPWITTFNC